MLNKEQEQTIGNGATAIQAGGSVIVINNNSGLTASDVKETCLTLLRANFPRLREEARSTAEGYVQSFAQQLEAKLADSMGSVLLDKLTDPDVQATINDAVQAAARKGEEANPDVLSQLIIERMSESGNEFQNIVYSEAVKVAPKLTRQHIAFLAFVLSIKELAFGKFNSLQDLERLYSNMLQYSQPGFGLSERQRLHIHYAGAASITGENALTVSRGGVTYASIYKNYENHGWDINTFMKETPSIGALLKAYSENKIESVLLTSVGRAIALSYMSIFMGNFNHTPWLV